MLDVAYVVFLEQIEGDGRAVVATGGSENPPQFYRDALDEILNAEADATPGRSVPAAQLELERGLGVA